MSPAQAGLTYCCQSLSVLIRRCTTLTQFTCFFFLAQPFSLLLHPFAKHLSPIITHPFTLVDALYRCLVLLFWASIAQSQVWYFEYCCQDLKELQTCFGLLAGFYFIRVLKQLHHTQTRSIPCLYIPICLFSSDICVVWREVCALDEIEFTIHVCRLSQGYAISFAYFAVKYYTKDLAVRVGLICGLCLYCRLVSVRLVPFLRSLRDGLVTDCERPFRRRRR